MLALVNQLLHLDQVPDAVRGTVNGALDLAAAEGELVRLGLKQDIAHTQNLFFNLLLVVLLMMTSVISLITAIVIVAISVLSQAWAAGILFSLAGVCTLAAFIFVKAASHHKSCIGLSVQVLIDALKGR